MTSTAPSTAQVTMVLGAIDSYHLPSYRRLVIRQNAGFDRGGRGDGRMALAHTDVRKHYGLAAGVTAVLTLSSMLAVTLDDGTAFAPARLGPGGSAAVLAGGVAVSLVATVACMSRAGWLTWARPWLAPVTAVSALAVAGLAAGSLLMPHNNLDRILGAMVAAGAVAMLILAVKVVVVARTLSATSEDT